MAVRDDFTAGEVLAAADLNDTFASKIDYPTGGADGNVLSKSGTSAAWAASAGVLIASATLSGSATDITGCFSAAFPSYFIVWDTTRGTNSYTSIRFLSGSTPASGASSYQTQFLQASSTTVSGNAQNTAEARLVEQANTDIEFGIIRLDRVFAASPTYALIDARNGGITVAATHRITSVRHDASTSYDGIQFLISAGTFSGGTVRVYGQGGA